MLPLFNNTTYLDKVPIRVSTQAVRHKDYFHFHKHIQMCFVLSGELKHIINGNEYTQPAGSCSFLLPYTPHIIDSSKSKDTPLIAHIWFRESFLKERGYQFLSYGKHTNFNGFKIPIISTFPAAREKAIRIMHELINEFAREKKLSFNKMAQLTAELFSLACTEPAPQKSDSLFNAQLECIDKATSYIETRFQEKISLDDLCKVAGMSRRSLTSHFRQITSLTPLQYIMSVRLQTAFKLIAETDMFFNDIARSTGLGNRSNLARVFIKNLGLPPSQFAEDYIKNTNHSHSIPTESRYKWLGEL